MNIHAFKRCISCVLSLLACVFALLIFNFNTSMAFAATETVAIYDYEYISNSQLNEYKNNLFEADTFYNDGYFLNYRYYMPDDMSESVPLIIALHGAGERGSDNDSQLNNAFVRPFIENENSKFYGAMVIAPQCPEKDYNNGWVNLYNSGEEADARNLSYSVDETEESDECRAIIALIEDTCLTYNIDRSRIYLIGLSQGAIAIYDLLARHSELFAAAVPIAGFGDPSKADIYAEIPIYAFHGDSDPIIPYEAGKEVYNAIEAQNKGLFNLIVYENGLHSVWEQAIVFPGTDTMPALEDWLFSQARSDTATDTTLGDGSDMSADTPLDGGALTPSQDNAESEFKWWIVVLAVAVILIAAVVIGVIIYKHRKKSARNG